MKKNVFLILLFLGMLGGYNAFSQSSSIRISDDFSGGNIKVEKIAHDSVWLGPDYHKSSQYWFYWYFKITGISGKTIHFQFPRKPVFTRFGPAYSINNNRTWKWYGISSYQNHGFDFTFSKKDTVVYFSMTFPYTQENLNNFLKEVRNGGNIERDTLAFTKEGRAVDELHIYPQKQTKYKVLITGRNHASETMGDYVIEGIMESILNELNLDYLRHNVEFCIIPFVDKDGVEAGYQGKWQIPHDHNRDYDEDAIYPEIKTIMNKVPGWSQEKLKIVLDVHCPYIRGHNDAEYICLVGSKDTLNQKQQIKFSKLIEKNNSGELKFYSDNFMRYGTRWNKDSNYNQGTNCADWGLNIPGIGVSTTLEFPYANVSGIAVSKDNARGFGRNVAYAIQDYLKSLDRKKGED